MTNAFPLTRRPAALLLDAGDTIIFFDPRAMAEALATEGHVLDPDRIGAALHLAKRHYQSELSRGVSHLDGWSILVEDLLVRAGLEPTHAREVLPALKRAHLDFNFWRRVPEDLAAALVRAREAGIRLGVVSNSEGKLLGLLERLELAPHFELILDSQLEGVQKPDPEIFRRALARMGVAAERALYAGDIPEVDVLGARGAGMHGVLIDTPGHYRDQPEWPSVPSVSALVDTLLRLPA